MKKVSKQEKVNLLFSAVLIIAFVLCSYFFSTVAITLASPWDNIVTKLIYVVFGLFLFYATRVGDGKLVFRFSLPSLIFVILPTLYIMVAQSVTVLPFNAQIASSSVITVLSAVAFGYGLPYTFVSGFELDNSDSNIEELSDEETEIEGQIEEQIEGQTEEQIEEQIEGQTEELQDDTDVQDTVTDDFAEETTAENQQTDESEDTQTADNTTEE